MQTTHTLPFATPEDVARIENKLEAVVFKLNKMMPEHLECVTYNNDELQKILDCSSRTLQIYRDKGLISFSQIGSKIWYTAKDVADFLERHRVKSRVQAA